MKNILIIIIALVFSSCSKEEKSTVTTWEADSFTINVTPIPIILGLSISPDFTTVGKDLNYFLELDESDMSWEVSGDYTLLTEFQNQFIPDDEAIFLDKQKSGFYTESENSLLFDDSLYDVEVQGMLWSKDDGSKIEFLLDKSGDRLIQEQSFMNIKVEQGMNANLVVRTEWKKK